MIKPNLLLFMVLLLALNCAFSVETDQSLISYRMSGDASYQRGNFTAALEYWNTAIANSRREGDFAGVIQATVNSAEVLGRLGRVNETFPFLLDVLGLAEKVNNPELQSLVRFGLAQSYFLVGEADHATELLIRALELIDNADNDKLRALILNALGNTVSAQGQQAEAIDYFEEAAISATDTGHPLIAATANINAAKTALFISQSDRSENYLEEAEDLLKGLPESYQQGFTLLSLGKVLFDIGTDATRLRALERLQQAMAIGERLNNPTIVSFASGYIGGLYEHEGRFTEATGFTNRALFMAFDAENSEAKYLWQWQMARLLKQQNRMDAAVDYYRQAIKTLARIRKDILATPVRRHISFRSSVAAVYYELADLLLVRSASSGINEYASKDLIEARDTIEQLKAAEVEDYFKDDCVTALENKKVALDKEVDAGTLVIYPIILRNRLELLVSSPENLRRFSVPVDDSRMIREIRAFRQGLENYQGSSYLAHARQLYRWLIAPIEKGMDTTGVDTLVFVPDGALRTIPMAPLFDGTRYLIEKYAVVTTPGLVLTDPRPMTLSSPKILLNGLSDSVQGFQALPAVKRELSAVHHLYGGKVLENEAFVSQTVKQELEKTSYSLVHIATHGKIEADVSDSYLLTYDGKLTIDDLDAYIGYSRYRVKGVELLTLSACETAVGDDRAALGLAGIALKAGARSALATLWSISDEATSELIPIFYRNLKQSATKAKALQQAQLQLLSKKQFSHPGFWAPFMLIGNWL